MPAAKVGLWLFFGVVGMLFSAFLSAYVVRMGLGGWTRLPEPPLLAVNTAVLALASGAMQWAWVRGRKGDLSAVGRGLTLGGALALLFVAGQAWAWRLLTGAGYPLASGPAADFFYLLTGIHALHLLGGVVALGWVLVRGWRTRFAGMGLAVELVTLYWHFLLGVWLVLYALLLLT